MEALDRHRGRAGSTIGVQNVSVANGGQAVVGNVTHNSAGPTDKSVVAPAITDAHTRPMEILGDPVREVVKRKTKS